MELFVKFTEIPLSSFSERDSQYFSSAAIQVFTCLFAKASSTFAFAASSSNYMARELFPLAAALAISSLAFPPLPRTSRPWWQSFPPWGLSCWILPGASTGPQGWRLGGQSSHNHCYHRWKIIYHLSSYMNILLFLFFSLIYLEFKVVKCVFIVIIICKFTG